MNPRDVNVALSRCGLVASLVVVVPVGIILAIPLGLVLIAQEIVDSFRESWRGH